TRSMRCGKLPSVIIPLAVGLALDRFSELPCDLRARKGRAGRSSAPLPNSRLHVRPVDKAVIGLKGLGDHQADSTPAATRAATRPGTSSMADPSCNSTPPRMVVVGTRLPAMAVVPVV